LDTLSFEKGNSGGSWKRAAAVLQNTGDGLWFRMEFRRVLDGTPEFSDQEIEM
jgi:hypothetical protein